MEGHVAPHFTPPAGGRGWGRAVSHRVNRLRLAPWREEGLSGAAEGFNRHERS